MMNAEAMAAASEAACVLISNHDPSEVDANGSVKCVSVPLATLLDAKACQEELSKILASVTSDVEPETANVPDVALGPVTVTPSGSERINAAQEKSRLTGIRRSLGSRICPVRCPKCPASFARRLSLKAHLADHDNEKPFKCSKCSDSFMIEGNLQLHSFLHSLDTAEEAPASERFTCPVCVAGFKRAAGLRSHIITAHFVDDVVKCEACEVEFTELREFKLHCEKHIEKPTKTMAEESGGQARDEKPSKEVREARKMFNARFPAKKKPKVKRKCPKQEVRLVGGSVITIEKPPNYQCSYCLKAFEKKTIFLRHLRVHTREKPFRCSMCGKLFSQKSCLNRHEKTHDGVKAFSCPFCPYSAAAKTNCKLHILRVHWDKIGARKLGALSDDSSKTRPVLRCPDCPCVFQRGSHLSAHQKKMHGDAVGKKRRGSGEINQNTESARTEADEPEDGARAAFVVPDGDLLERTLFSCGIDPSLLRDGDFPLDQVVLEARRPDGTVQLLSFGDPPPFLAADSLESEASAVSKALAVERTSEERKQRIASEPSVRLASPIRLADPKKPADVVEPASETVLPVRENRPHVCPDCGLAFKKASHLRDHVDAKHAPLSAHDFACEVCEKRFPTQRLLSSHIQSHGPEDKYVCEICSKAFKYQNVFKRHALVHQVEKQFACPYCKKKFRFHTSCRRHIKGYCPRAPAASSSSSDPVALKSGRTLGEQLDPEADHILLESETGDGQVLLFVKDDDIGDGEANMDVDDDHLQRSVAAVIFNQARSDPSVEVGKGTGTVSVVGDGNEEGHLTNPSYFLVETEPGEISLVISTPDLNLLRRSSEDELDEGSAAAVPDEEADDGHELPEIPSGGSARVERNGIEALAQESEMDYATVSVAHEDSRHMVVGRVKREASATWPASKLKPGGSPKSVGSACHYCQKLFRKKSDLARHLRVHSGEKPFGCDACGRAFGTAYALASHRLVHFPGNKVECPVCKKLFANKSARNLHLRIHTGDRPFACHICNHRFRTSGHLASHMRAHTKEELATGGKVVSQDHENDPSPFNSLDILTSAASSASTSTVGLLSRLADQNRPPSDVLDGGGVAGDDASIHRELLGQNPRHDSELDLDPALDALGDFGASEILGLNSHGF